jgi:hypothetical protein
VALADTELHTAGDAVLFRHRFVRSRRLRDHPHVVLGIGSSQPPVERRRISVELRAKIV